MALPNNSILEILISITLIYALLSILVSILLEWWNYYTKARAKLLRESISQLLHDPINRQYGDMFYEHFMISGLKNASSHRPPQYISSSMFAEVLIDIIANQSNPLPDSEENSHTNPDTAEQDIQAAPEQSHKIIDRFKLSMQSMHPSPFRSVLQSFWDKSDGDYTKLKIMIEKWFDDYMDRVSGWYKSRQKYKFIFFGFLVAFGLNVDSIHMIKILSMDEQLRGRTVGVAENVADNYQAESDSASLSKGQLLSSIHAFSSDTLNKDSSNRKKTIVELVSRQDSAKFELLKKKLNFTDSISQLYMQKADSVLGIAANLNLPIGWDLLSAPASWLFAPPVECDCDRNSKGLLLYIDQRNNCPSLKNWTMWFLGILISAVSLSFGAPFWFEMMIKLVNIRRSGNKPNGKRK